MAQKIVLFVDGSNLFGGLTELLADGSYLNFQPFIKQVQADFAYDEILFYATYMKVDTSKNQVHKRQVMAQKAFFDSAKATPKVKFVKGHFSGSGKEKGVDVKLAVDMTVGACQNRFDEAVIMTGDADLRYAVEITKKLKKPVHLAAIGSRFPFGISVVADHKVVYDYGGYFVRELVPQYRRKPKDLIVRELKGKIKVSKI